MLLLLSFILRLHSNGEEMMDIDEQDFSNFLKRESYHKNIFTTIEHNRLFGFTFFMLALEELKELSPVTGNRATQ